MVAGNGFLGLNRLITRVALVEKNNLSEAEANAVFARVQPVQDDQDGTALYLEGMVDRAIEEVRLKAIRLSSPVSVFFSDKEDPNMIAWGGTDDLVERGANLLYKILEQFLLKTQSAHVPEASQASERMLTPSEAAKEMRLNVQTVMAWCRNGRITASKSVGKWLIPREEVERHLHAYEVKNGKKKGGAK